jgi:ribonuclease E
MADDDFTPGTDAPTESAEATADGGAAPDTPADNPADPPAKKAAKKTTAKKTAAKKSTAKKSTTKKAAAPASEDAGEAPLDASLEEAPAKKTASKRAATRKTAKKAASPEPADGEQPSAEQMSTDETSAETVAATKAGATQAAPETMLLFKAPEPTAAPARRRRAAPSEQPTVEPSDQPEGEAAAVPLEADADSEAQPAAKAPARKRAAKKTSTRKSAAAAPADDEAPLDDELPDDQLPDDQDSEDARDAQEEPEDDSAEGGEGGARRRRRRGGRRRRKSGDGEAGADDSESGAAEPEDAGDAESDREGTSRRRRRRRREGDDSGGGDDPDNTVTRVRKPRSAEDEITAIAGSTRLEAKKQRRREGREAGRRRAPIVSEAEFLARRESVDRVMVIRQRDDLTQIGVLEDKVLVEHYVARESQTSLIGNVYLGRVQNVLPSMEAAFIDIGKGRNAVLYAGEVNWSALGHKEGSPRKIESVLSSGQTVLVQVTKDPVGHKGARLTSQVSLAGRFLVYVPDGTTSGISRKLPDTERNRLKSLLKEIVPDTAGVIVRTAAEGASEEELTRDVERLKARWEDIEAKTKGGSPKLLYGEPDLTLKVVRDLFTEDFAKLVIQGDDAWESVTEYVRSVAPDLEERLEKYDGNGTDIFAAYRVDEQIAKALDRKVWLPSGGSLIIDRTEAMTVVDVNTGKFTGSGGNLEETVTKNNLEAAEEVVRQLRLRDIGGIIVVDFIDMVLESNRDLVLRRLVECLGRDRTRHQVAEVTSLGLVQMTRKRIGTGLVEAFSENCPHCQGRGLVLHEMPVEPAKADDEQRRGGGRRRGGRGRGQDDDNGAPRPVAPSPKDIAAMAKPPQPADEASDVSEVFEVFEDREAEAATAPETSTARTTPMTPAEGGSDAEPRGTEEPESAEVAGEVAPGEVVVTRRTRKPSRARREQVVPAESSVDSSAESRAESPAESPAEVPAEVPAETSAEVPAAAEETAPAPVSDQREPDAPLTDQREVAAPAAPRVVTRTRRSASRPAGTPVRTTPEPVAPIRVPNQPASDGAPAPEAQPAAPAAVEPPRVVTRTRGRSASRAAGPPEHASGDGLGGGDGDTPVVEHVPIKKKGARKR